MGLIKGPILPFLKDKIKKHEYLLTSEIKFDAAHRLSNYKGKCSRIHGHTYRIVTTVKSFKLNDLGMVIDFYKLKNIFKKHIEEKYDHKTILLVDDNENQILGRVMHENWVTWMSNNPTAENIAKDIWDDLIPVIKMFKDVKLDSITVYETVTNSATYREKL